MPVMPDLVVYLDVTADEAEQLQQVLKKLGKVPGVDSVDVRVEGAVRTWVPGIDPTTITSITLTLTALGGAAGAASMLLDKVRGLIESARGLHKVMVETKHGAKPIESVVEADIEKQG